jgi:hypothetical protein
MQDLLTKAVATTQTAAKATLELQADLNTAGMDYAKASLELMGKPFDADAVNSLAKTLFEAHKKALVTWGKTQSELFAQAVPGHKA